MILYHGSYLEIKHPDTIHSRETVDFGRGFYTTPLREQAVKWSQKFFDGLIAKEEAIKRLQYEKPNYQIAFRTQDVIDKYLHFERSELL